jgi:homoserine O-acetyltransferase
LVARDLTDNPFDVSTVVDGVLDLPASMRLYYGDSLPHPRVAFRLEGPANAPVVAVLGGISAHRHLIGGEGWWPATVGPGLGVDSTRFRVLGLDYLGGLGGSSTPDGEAQFPPVSSIDQAEVLRQVVLHLGLGSLHAIVGASYGGMVALCFAARHPALSGRIVVVSAADRPQVLSTVEGYLFARGDDYVQKYRAESFLALSESIDLHEVDAAQVRTPATLIAVREDQLVPFGDMQALAARLGGPTRLVEINSIFGHDAFLKESAVLNPILQNALAE